MSSPAVTKQLVDEFKQTAPAPQFFASMATTRVFTAEEIELDIEREDEDAAVVLRDIADGPNYNRSDFYTRKTYKPPVYKEAAAIGAGEVGKGVEFGETGYGDISFQARATGRAMDLARKLLNKINRAREMQLAQIFTTGELELTDDDGNPRYVLDFGCDATQFPSPPSALWGETGADPLADLEGLAYTVQQLGYTSTDFRVVMGRRAQLKFLGTESVQNLLDKKSISIGEMHRPQMAGGGALHGSISAGQYNFDIWSYTAQYKFGGVRQPYMPPDGVLLLPKDAVIRVAYGNIPRFAPADSRALSYLPGNLVGAGYSVNPNAWISPDGETLTFSIGTRMLAYPLTINKFGYFEPTEA